MAYTFSTLCVQAHEGVLLCCASIQVGRNRDQENTDIKTKRRKNKDSSTEFGNVGEKTVREKAKQYCASLSSFLVSFLSSGNAGSKHLIDWFDLSACQRHSLLSPLSVTACHSVSPSSLYLFPLFEGPARPSFLLLSL
mmetsp:Transcript_41731/g.82386  ORF Transcript_41731/g.82386 Transcript_41731/m.82386 type:complete len:138 (-) Transcript_41731:2218-2631(-)